MQEVRVSYTQVDSELEAPAYAQEGDAGLDLRSRIDIELQPFERALIPCGIQIAIPQGYAGFVLPRSGSAIKQGLSLVNAPGLIDSGFRGEIQAIAINLDPKEAIHIQRGDRIAQLVILEVPFVSLQKVDELTSTVRGEGGFGSSGVQ